MASMPHITVKVESSQVQRLIEIADQLRRVSDDLREVIRKLTIDKKWDGVQVMTREDADAVVREHSRVGYQPERPADVVDVAPEDLTPPSGESPISTPPASSGYRSTGTSSYSRDDPDAIQDAP